VGIRVFWYIAICVLLKELNFKQRHLLFVVMNTDKTGIYKEETANTKKKLNFIEFSHYTYTEEAHITAC
jgi:hypothetical protein